MFRHFKYLFISHARDFKRLGLRGLFTVVRNEYRYTRKMGAVYGIRTLKRFAKKLLGLPQLTSIFLCPSHKCNANCVHCFEKLAGHNKEKLSTELLKSLIDQFCGLSGALVHFCSGEFLLRKDAIELIRYCRDRQLRVCVTTNGILLNDEKLDEIKEAGVNQISVSLDSADPETHDKIRRVPGCFEKAINGLRGAHDRGMEIMIYSYVSKSNLHELEGIAELCRKNGIVTFVFFPLLSGHFFNRPEENLSFEEREAFRKKYNPRGEVQLEFPSEKSPCMGGGKLHFSVMPNAEVTFCPPVPYSYGNVNEKSLKDCWKDMTRDYQRFFLTKLTGQCPVNFQEYRDNCNAKYIYPDFIDRVISPQKSCGKCSE